MKYELIRDNKLGDFITINLLQHRFKNVKKDGDFDLKEMEK